MTPAPSRSIAQERRGTRAQLALAPCSDHDNAAVREIVTRGRPALKQLRACRGEWKLIAATHNLLKLWRVGCAPAETASVDHPATISADEARTSTSMTTRRAATGITGLRETLNLVSGAWPQPFSTPNGAQTSTTSVCEGVELLPRRPPQADPRCHRR